ISTIRLEHGIFSLLFVAGYLYAYVKESKKNYKYLIFVPLTLVGILFLSTKIDSFIAIANDTSTRYSDFSLESSSSDSFGARLLQLPFGLKHVTIGLFSQTMPFPFYTSIVNNGLWFFPEAIAAVFWFIVIFRLIYI